MWKSAIMDQSVTFRKQIHKNHIFQGLVYTISDYFSCRIAFLNPVQKTLRSMSVYTKSVKQSSDTISCQNKFITSTKLVFFFGGGGAFFPKQSINFICAEAILSSKRCLGAFRIGLRCLHVKQNGTDCTGSIFVPPADAEQSCTGLLEQSVSDSCWAV